MWVTIFERWCLSQASKGWLPRPTTPCPWAAPEPDRSGCPHCFSAPRTYTRWTKLRCRAYAVRQDDARLATCLARRSEPCASDTGGRHFSGWVGKVKSALSGTCSLLIYFTCIYSVFLVTVHDPICTDSGDLKAALYGSFFPIPPDDFFPPIDDALYARENTPGAIVAKKEDIVINKGRKRVKLRVINTGDRPIQVIWDIAYFYNSQHTYRRPGWVTLPFY